MICSNADDCSCWSVLKPTEGSYFISRDNLFFSVCHMVLQLQRSNRFVDVNFSSLLKIFESCGDFHNMLVFLMPTRSVVVKVPCQFCKQLWMVPFFFFYFAVDLKDSFGKGTWIPNCQLECSDYLFFIRTMIRTRDR